ncbi:hypothetical protein GCM10027347_17680 [Larkinella harenae]
MLFKDTGKIDDQDGLKAYLGGIQKTMAWDTWRPFVENAELTYILPAIGQGLYDELLADNLSDVKKRLKHRLKMAVAWFAYAEALPSLATTTGDGGIVVPTPGNSAVMPKWLYLEARKKHEEKADRNLEAALVWLEANADLFPDWKQSEFYTIQNSRFIRSATEASKFFPAIRSSRRLFLAIRNYFNTAEDDQIRPVLGGLYPVLLERMKEGTLSAQEAEALRLARQALVQLGFAEAVPYLNLNTEFRLVYDIDGGAVAEQPLNSQRLEIIHQKALSKGEAKRAELINYLNANASAQVLAAYFQSPLYVAPQGVLSRRFPNQPGNSFYVL